jgi:hypothetical protein
MRNDPFPASSVANALALLISYWTDFHQNMTEPEQLQLMKGGSIGAYGRTGSLVVVDRRNLEPSLSL